jgi:hypothetical protein
MAERATPYRNELESLRARRVDLEERLEAERAEVERQREEVKALRQALALRDGATAPTPRVSVAWQGGPEGVEHAPLPIPTAEAPAPRTLVPSGADPSNYVACVVLCLFVSLLMLTRVSLFVAFGFMALLSVPLWLSLLVREKLAKRYLRADLACLEFRSYDRKVRRIAWSDLEATRIFIKHGRHQNYSVLQLRVRGQKDWVELDRDYFSDGESLAAFVDSYRRA